MRVFKGIYVEEEHADAADAALKQLMQTVPTFDMDREWDEAGDETGGYPQSHHDFVDQAYRHPEVFEKPIIDPKKFGESLGIKQTGEAPETPV